jgi:hypothetical protein
MASSLEVPDPRETIAWDIRDTVTVEPGAPIPLESHTRVELQPGVHRLTSDQVNNDLAHYRLLGDGADCTIETDGNHRWLVKAFGAPGPIEIGGVVVDYGAETDTSGAGINLAPTGSLWVHDIRWEGFTPAEETGDDWKCNVRIKADAPGWVERVESIGGAHMGGHLDGKGMGIVDYHHEGTLYFRDNYIEEEPGDTPWYTQGHGENHFIRCYHVNNAMANFRIGGQSSVRDCVSVQDHDAIDEYTGEFNAAHDCLVATQINHNQTGAVIEGCEFICRSTDTSSTSIRTHLTSGDVTIRDTRIQHDEGRPFIHKNADYGSHKYEWVTGEDSAIHWANVDVSGAAGVEHVFDHDRRSHCTVTESCVAIDHETLCTGGGTDVSDLETSDAERPTDHDPRAATPFESDPAMPDETPTDDGDSTDSAPTPYPHTFQIEGTGDRATWRVVVDGSLTHDSAQGTNDSEDTYGTTEANGVVLSGTDGGRFSGSITALELDGDATVFVDGDEVDPAEYGGADGDASDGSDGADAGDGSDSSGGGDEADGGTSSGDGSTAPDRDVALEDITLADVAALVQQRDS